MITINCLRVEGHVHVRVNRWPQEGRYPQLLFDFELLDCPGESELGQLARVARSVELIAEARRRELEPALRLVDDMPRRPAHRIPLEERA